MQTLVLMSLLQVCDSSLCFLYAYVNLYANNYVRDVPLCNLLRTYFKFDNIPSGKVLADNSSQIVTGVVVAVIVVLLVLLLSIVIIVVVYGKLKARWASVVTG